MKIENKKIIDKKKFKRDNDIKRDGPMEMKGNNRTRK